MSGRYTAATNSSHAAATMATKRRSPPNDLLRDRLKLQVGRAFVDLSDLRVAPQLLDRIVLHEAVAAVEIDRERRDALGHLRREDLAHGGFGEERLPGVAQACGVVDHQPRRLELGRRARKLMLH